MGTVKSIRFNRKTESMFNVVKDYMSKSNRNITDSDIILSGIQIQYEKMADDLNGYFRKKMLEEITDGESVDVFNQTANMLEVLSLSFGDTLESQFWCFLLVNAECGSVYEVDGDEKFCQTKQYEKIYETLNKSFDDDILDNAISEINSAYKKLFGKES